MRRVLADTALIVAGERAVYSRNNSWTLSHERRSGAGISAMPEGTAMMHVASRSVGLR